MSDRNSRRATRLALLFPRQWRRRYPDFMEALGAELADHPRGVRADVLRAAAVERLRAGGILPARPADRARSGLALIYAALLPFVGLSTGMWSQLRTATAGHGAALPVLHAADLLLATGSALALVSLAITVPLIAAHSWRRAPETLRTMSSGPFTGPVVALAAAVAVLTAGGWAADRSRWYSPAAAALPTRGLGHILTLWARGIIAGITPAWVHPTLFGRMPTGDLIATLAAPVGALAASAALLCLLARVPVPASRRAHVVVAVTTVGAMFLAAAATARWLLALSHPSGAASPLARAGQLAPGHTPWAVAVALFALAVTAAVGTRRVLQGGQAPSGRGGPGTVRAGSSRPEARRPTSSDSIASIAAES